jgi:acetyl-CoA carboxylase biotin carboxyl carrier protein
MNLLLERLPDGVVLLRSPGVGWWCEAPQPGAVLSSGARVGRLDVLGRYDELTLPANVSGRLVESAGAGKRRHPVAYGEVLLRLDALTAWDGDDGNAAAEEAASEAEGAGAFLAPSAGRFYGRPSPDDPPFVAPGDDLSKGQVVGVIEVMKTFTQLHFKGADARLVRVVPQDGDDIEEGDVVLELDRD